VTEASKAPIVQLVECILGKDEVAGSIPARSSIRAGVAQSVEPLTCNEEAGGSMPSTSSIRWCSTTVVQGFRKAEAGGSIPPTSSIRQRGQTATRSAKTRNAKNTTRKYLIDVTFRGLVAQLGERLVCTQEVAGSKPVGSTKSRGSVAQMEEHWTENPGVGGSIPSWPTMLGSSSVGS
jgi:hypothetical protein